MEAGSTVVLNGGGPDMLVLSVSGDTATVRYWPDDGPAQSGEFPVAAVTVKSPPALDMADLMDDYISRPTPPSRLVVGPEFAAQFKAHPGAGMFSPGKYLDAELVADPSTGLWYRFE